MPPYSSHLARTSLAGFGAGPSLACPSAKASSTSRGTRVTCAFAAWLLVLLGAGCDAAGGATSAPRPPSSVAPKAAGAHAPAPSASSSLATPTRSPEPGIVIRGGGRNVVAGRHGVVTSVESQATRAGIGILERGGNAVDAAVAVAFALAVTHPSAGNLGGGGFMLVSRDDGVTAIDFRESAPAKLPRARFDRMIASGGAGPDSVAVPGTPAGLCLAQERFGRLTLAEVIEPAIDLARRGYVVGARQALALEWSWLILRQNPAFLARFARPGTRDPVAAGTRLTQPKLAKTLASIAERGRAGFYEGAVAASVLDSLGRGRLMTPDDLTSYRAKTREPLRFWYRGLEVVTMPPPSAGGVALALTLSMLETERAHTAPPDSALAVHLLVEAAKRAHAERRFGVVDPDVLGPGELEARVRRWTSPNSLLSEHPIVRGQAVRSERIHPLFTPPREDENTTHFSVVDAAGMAVSCTVTLSASFGAKLIADDSGVILNNAVASFSIAGDNLPTGGRRTVSSMAPTLVFADQKLVLVLGSPGGDTIPNTITQVLRNIVDRGMTLDAAVDAPRIHHGFIPDQIRLERPLAPPLRRELEQMGHRFAPHRSRIGDANSILLDGATAHAYADRREGGLALAAKPRKPPKPTTSPAE
ncbi:MAG TPA: gamma-glutamyltransferase [Polyangiaceae bacterium]